MGRHVPQFAAKEQPMRGVTGVTREYRIEALSNATTDLLKQLNELSVLREQVRLAQAAARRSRDQEDAKINSDRL